MSNAVLETKFADLARGIPPEAQARRVMDLRWRIAERPDAGAVLRAGAEARRAGTFVIDARAFAP